MSEPFEPNPAPPTWTAVGPDDDAAPPPIPTWAKVLGVTALALLVVLAGLLGTALGRWSPTPAPSATPSPSPSPSFELTPPVQVGEFVAGDITESAGPAPLNQRIVRASYSDGTDRLLLVLTWPEEDIDTFVTGAGIEDAQELTAGTICGTSLDTDLPACARLSGDTGLLLLAVTEQRPTVVAALLSEFERALVD